jgi:hypothetical protein
MRCPARGRRRGCAAARCACAGCRRAARAVGQVVAPAQAVVAVVGLVEERVFAGGPVEFPAVDDDAADARAVAAEPFGQRVHHDVGAVFDRAGEVGRGEGRIHDQRQAVRVGDVRRWLRGRRFPARDWRRFAEQRAGLVVDGLGEVLRVVGIDERTSMPSAGRMSLNWV